MEILIKETPKLQTSSINVNSGLWESDTVTGFVV